MDGLAVCVGCVHAVIVLVLPEKSRLLSETLTDRSRAVTKFCNSSCQRKRNLWQRILLPLVSYVNKTVNFPTCRTQTPNTGIGRYTWGVEYGRVGCLRLAPPPDRRTNPRVPPGPQPGTGGPGLAGFGFTNKLPNRKTGIPACPPAWVSRDACPTSEPDNFLVDPRFD